MAHMYPEQGPSDDCQSDAERKLYFLLRDRLPPEYHVIHSARWNSVASNGRIQPGEADFIVIHPDHGILVIEVKGGRISHNAHAGRWYTIDRNDKKSQISDPFAQAMKSAKVLEAKVRQVPRTAAHASLYRIAYGVWFPDTIWPRGQGTELRMLDEQTLDQLDLTGPEPGLARLFRFTQSGSPSARLSTDALDALLSLLIIDIATIDSPLSDEMPLFEGFAADAAVIARLTDEQADRLWKMCHDHTQLAVPGHAGTGKTVVAVEMAWRLANDGYDVLFLCANQSLADFISRRVSTDRPAPPHPIQVRSLPDLVRHAAFTAHHRRNEVANLAVTRVADQDKMGRILQESQEVLAREGHPLTFDAVLVDEAQDINRTLWEPLRRLLRDPEHGYFYAFYDAAQRDLEDRWDPERLGIPISEPLLVNRRNTGTIYELMGQLNHALLEVPFIGPPGRPVAYYDPREYESAARDTPGADAQTLALQAALDDLTGPNGGVRPEQILIITCRSADSYSANATRWLHAKQRNVGRHILRWLSNSARGCVSLSTVRSSKGLESMVVVLAELEGVAREKRSDALLYTAISRARHHLVVVGSRADLAPRQTGWWLRYWPRTTARPSTRPRPVPPAPPLRTEVEASEPLPALPADFEPSEYQRAIFDFVRRGNGDGIVTAVAGSGKTTTLVYAARVIGTTSAVFLAFNKHVVGTLSQRLGGTSMVARTIHGTGYACLRRALGSHGWQINEYKYQILCQSWASAQLLRESAIQQRRVAHGLAELARLARLTLTPQTDHAALRAMIVHYDVDVDSPRIPELLDALPSILCRGEGIARDERTIDYTDMIYLPHLWDLTPVQSHWVFVDEAQDLNAAQQYLALKCRAPGGRMLFVGDPHQAIYGFSGADNEAISTIGRRTNATELPLSICYRCPTSHVKLAQDIVPQIQARPGAPEGTIQLVAPHQLRLRLRKGDLILCRRTAPLVAECIRLIQHRIHARVKGRDIGEDLAAIVQHVTELPGYTWQAFGGLLDEYERQQAVKLAQLADGQAQLESLHDRVEATRVCFLMFQARDAGELCVRVTNLFHDGQPDILLSTVHRAKGLEYDRVFLLQPETMPLKWPGQQQWQLQQEENIKYVALTRSKRELYLVPSGILSDS